LAVFEAQYSAPTNHLSFEVYKGLVLWKDFLVVAHTGIDLNLLTTQEPNNLLRTDACEHGLGGYALKTGRAWRWEIPLHLRGRKLINFL
jgi:hypothetical protein